MPASKRETFLEYLRTTLFPTVKVANGYNHTLKTIERGQRNPASLAGRDDFPALFIVTAPERRQNITTNKFESKLEVVFVAYVKNSKASPSESRTGIQLDLDRIIQDITKALYADESHGGLVLGTEVTQIDPDDGDNPALAGVVISAEFQYVSEAITP